MSTDFIKIAAELDSPKLLGKAMAQMSEEGFETDVIEEKIIEGLGIGAASDGMEVIKFILNLRIEEADFEDKDYVIFDKCISSLGPITAPFTDYNQNLLQFIVESGNIPLVKHFKEKFLQDKNLQKKLIMNMDKSAMSAIHYAAKMGDGDMLDLLLDFSGSYYVVNKKSFSGSPLSLALANKKYGQDSASYKLLEAGIDPKKSLTDGEFGIYKRALAKMNNLDSKPALKLLKSIIGSDFEIIDPVSEKQSGLMSKEEIDVIMANLQAESIGRKGSLAALPNSHKSSDYDSGCEMTPILSRKFPMKNNKLGGRIVSTKSESKVNQEMDKIPVEEGGTFYVGFDETFASHYIQQENDLPLIGNQE